MDIPIESGVELPAITRPRTKEPLYPFDKMKVGQSFVVPLDGDPEEQVLNRLRTAVNRYTKQQSGTVKFTVRAMPDGVRTWRLA
jgi:hypothetical protein